MASPFDAMTGGASGFSNFGRALGTALGGGDGETYYRTMSRGHELQRKLADARKATAELNALERLPQTLEAAGVPNATALADIITSGTDTFQGSTKGFQNLQDYGLVERAIGALSQDATGLDAIQEINAIRSGKPFDRTKIAGGTAYDPLVTPDAAGLIITPSEALEQDTKRIRAEGLNAASMAGALRPRGTTASGDGREKEYRRLLNQAAQEALSNAKLNDYDVSGLTVKDVAVALETTGEFTTRDGHTVGTWDIKPEDLDGEDEAPADFSGVTATVTQSTLPPEARAQLKEGSVTTFRNGQRWTLRGGQPVRVP